VKEKLAAKGITSIPQGVARRKFSEESFGKSSEMTRNILRRTGF